jgi:hypothetical protein
MPFSRLSAMLRTKISFHFFSLLGAAGSDDPAERLRILLLLR